MTEVIRLRNIRDEETTGFELDPLTGLYRIFALPRLSSAGIRGFADIRRIGLRKPDTVFAAIYAADNQLHVAIPPQHFTWPGTYAARRTTLLMSIKAFSIKSGSRTFLNFLYTFSDSRHEFPGPEAVDIFAMIAWKTSSLEEVRTTICLWEGLANGEDIASSEFQLRLESVKASR